MSIQKENINAIECRFAVQCPRPKDQIRDLHVVKEIIHTKDGKTAPNLRLIWDYKRPFWITKKGCRNHQQKKEWEKLDNLQQFSCTQSNLISSVAQAMGEPWYKGDLRKLCRSPYIYGADILSTALIKQRYKAQYPDVSTGFSVACFDVETDVLYGTEEIIMATLSYKDRVVTCIQKSYFEGHVRIEEQLMEKMDKYLSEYVEKRKIKWEIIIVEDELEAVTTCMKRAHEWKPDFVAIWNITFDLGKIINALEKRGVDPKDVFSDPSIPQAYRFFKFKIGPSQKVTASGKVTPIKNAARWHTVFCPASFYLIDAMCAYRHIRTGDPEEPSYALDEILDKKLGIRKLKFKEADGYERLEWHQVMQKNFKFEYVIYNVFDCVSMEELDEKTNDLVLTLPMLSKNSDFENFKSQPRRLVDDLHFVVQEKGLVIATTSDEMQTEDDEDTVDLTNWITTLPAHLVVDNGLKIIEENPSLSTNIRVGVGDLDVKAAYPTNEVIFNVSKETTIKEICSIEGISDATYRAQAINLSGGHTNSVEFCQFMFGLPSLDKMLQHYHDVKNGAEVIDDHKQLI